VGGLAGGAMGYWGGQKAFNSVFKPDANRDYVSVTAPGGNPLAKAQVGQETTLKIGEGKLQVDVRVTDQRVSATATVSQQPSLVRVNAGNTNPGGF
jgi:hypothetical protein